MQDEFFDTAPVMGGLRARVVRGGLWIFALRITNRLFGLVRTIILARLLAPADFGVFGIALLAMSALETFSQTGFGATLLFMMRNLPVRWSRHRISTRIA